MTIPADVLRKADRLARQWDRSRSWVIAEAIRRVDEGLNHQAGKLVAEPPAEPFLAEAAREARTRHLRYALSLSPGARLEQAEELTRMRSLRPRRDQVVSFETLEDFARWKKARRAEG